MADRVSASIALGGTLTASTFAELVDIITLEGLSAKWDGEPFEPRHREIGKPLYLYAHEVAWGRFSELEAWCFAHRLPFTRWSGGCAGQFGPERVVFTGTGSPSPYAVTEDDEVVIARERLVALGSFEAVLTYFDAADATVPPLIVEGDALAEPSVPDLS